MKVASHTLGFKSYLKDLKEELSIQLETDSTGAMGMASRRGLSKVRHIDSKFLWVQQKVAAGVLKLKKILGTTTSTDMLTKYKSFPEIETNMSRVGFRYV